MFNWQLVRQVAHRVSVAPTTVSCVATSAGYRCDVHTQVSPDLSTSTYEGDGKTKVNILNRELDLGLMINSYSQLGFRLNNELRVVGPMAIFPRSVLSWNVGDAGDINESTLSLFTVLEPKIDVLVIGLGDAVAPEVAHRIMAFSRKHKVNVEILTTESACATFNFLNAEQRMVAGAFIPPTQLRLNENDMMNAQRRNNQLYEVDNF